MIFIHLHDYIYEHTHHGSGILRLSFKLIHLQERWRRKALSQVEQRKQWETFWSVSSLPFSSLVLVGMLVSLESEISELSESKSRRRHLKYPHSPFLHPDDADQYYYYHPWKKPVDDHRTVVLPAPVPPFCIGLFLVISLFSSFEPLKNDDERIDRASAEQRWRNNQQF